jgi:hypothetical protein
MDGRGIPDILLLRITADVTSGNTAFCALYLRCSAINLLVSLYDIRTYDEQEHHMRRLICVS